MKMMLIMVDITNTISKKDVNPDIIGKRVIMTIGFTRTQTHPEQGSQGTVVSYRSSDSALQVAWDKHTSRSFWSAHYLKLSVPITNRNLLPLLKKD
jgi:hypothetical protein